MYTNLADCTFSNMCYRILQEGTSTEGIGTRPVWQDDSSAHSLKLFGAVNRYNLSAEFPIITLRKTHWRSAIDEILWIYQKKSNYIEDLNSRIWDQWADSNGTIGKAYGYQLRQKHNYPEGMFDQVDKALYDLKHNPGSRSIRISMYNHADLSEMALRPCAHSIELSVTKDPQRSDKLILDMVLHQRSQDAIVAGNWNTVQYAALQHMFAQVSDMEVGQLLHVITDAHIYIEHIPIAQRLLDSVSYPAPTFTMDKSITNFYDFTVDSFNIENYQYNTDELFNNIPVAK